MELSFCGGRFWPLPHGARHINTPGERLNDNESNFFHCSIKLDIFPVILVCNTPTLLHFYAPCAQNLLFSLVLLSHLDWRHNLGIPNYWGRPKSIMPNRLLLSLDADNLLINKLFCLRVIPIYGFDNRSSILCLKINQYTLFFTRHLSRWLRVTPARWNRPW